MDVSSVVNRVLGRIHCTSDIIDRINYIGKPFMLAMSILITAATTFIRTPIICDDVPIEGFSKDYTSYYCFGKGVYREDPLKVIYTALNTSEREKRMSVTSHIYYYQTFPFVLLSVLLLYKVNDTIWKGVSVPIRDFIFSLRNEKILERQKYIYNNEDEIRKLFNSKNKFAFYLFYKINYILIDILLLSFFTYKFFDGHPLKIFTLYNEVFYRNTYNIITAIFPMYGFCDIYSIGIGSQRYNLIPCILGFNIINEKIVFILFLFTFLTMLLNIISLVYIVLFYKINNRHIYSYFININLCDSLSEEFDSLFRVEHRIRDRIRERRVRKSSF